MHKVAKPSRYINHELNAYHKDFETAEVRFCLAFPDVYEVGISHLGLKILYSIINQLDYAMADRTYLPWMDAIDLMRENRIPLFALESKQQARDFDVLGITLQSELNFTNVLELLDLSQIPIHANKRTFEHPIVIAGGPCASNPLPLQPFIDAFLIGEGEEAIEEITKVIRSCKQEYLSLIKTDNKKYKSEVLQRLSNISGVYVPALHDTLLDSGKINSIKIRKYNAFNQNVKTHAPQLMSWQMATHNRYVAEIMRGCTRGCRFCHAGYFYRPIRERNPEDILDSLLKEIEAYGWEEAGLISLSSSDYTCIRPLLEALLKKIDQQKTHVSLPSLRVDSFDDALVSLLKEVGREGLTIAPEAGSQRLRNVINKNLSEQEILHGVRIAKDLGWQKIKLYFMLGLPTETDTDVQGIIDLINLIIGETGKRFQINVSLSPFVPKSHTPFQWTAMLEGDDILRRALLVKHAFQRQKFVKVRYHTIESSMLEAVISRGDTNTAEWIEQAWKLGARYDGWNEGFNWEYWTQAANTQSYDYNRPLQSFELNHRLPWDFIDIGIEKDWLIKEWNKALQESVTEDCRNGCIACGICDDNTFMKSADENPQFEREIMSLPVPPVKEPPGKKANYIKSWHYRLTYVKGGDFRFIGHLDWMRMVFRLMGRSNLPIVYTQGFNPHPKISFCPALAVGVTGENEYFDFHVSDNYDSEEMTTALSSLFIGGLSLKYIEPTSSIDTQPVADNLTIICPAELGELIKQKVCAFNKLDTLPLELVKKDSVKTYDLKQVIIKINFEETQLTLTKMILSPNIYVLLSKLFDLPKESFFEWDIIRKGFEY